MRRGTFLKRGAALLGGLAVAGKLPPSVLEDAVAASPAPEALPGAAGLSRSLVATGGLCAPVTPYYDLKLCTSPSPVREALPSFAADRGGIRFTDAPEKRGVSPDEVKRALENIYDEWSRT